MTRSPWRAETVLITTVPKAQQGLTRAQGLFVEYIQEGERDEQMETLSLLNSFPSGFPRVAVKYLHPTPSIPFIVFIP